MQRKLGNAWLITIITSTFEKVQCVVRENIHTPTTELEIPRGEGGGGGGGQRPRKFQWGRGWTIKITFQGVNFELSMKIATY